MFPIVWALPQHRVSRALGWLANRRWPPRINRQVLRTFVQRYGVAEHDAARPLDSYQSLGEFFTRNLKPGLRPIGPGFVSPVDGTLRGAGRISSGHVEQVKGVSYTIAELLGDAGEAERYVEGTYFNFYLSPRDYHHVHSPVGGTIVRARYLPGRLWPVNDWAYARVPRLLCRNERLVTYLKTAQGCVAVVMVGAFNVGKLSAEYDAELLPDEVATRHGQIGDRTRSYEPGHAVTAGQRLGTFHLGSSVVVLAERGALDIHEVAAGSTVRYGQPLASLRA